jgi:hypothetical protein
VMLGVMEDRRCQRACGFGGVAREFGHELLCCCGHRLGSLIEGCWLSR